MEKKVFKNRIRVVLADKMVTKTHLAEQLGVSKMTNLNLNIGKASSDVDDLIGGKLRCVIL